MSNPSGHDESEVRAVLDGLVRAIRHKDARGALATLASDVVAYDLAPPLRWAPDAARYASVLEAWFGTWATPIGTEAHDLSVAVGGDVAYAFGLRHMTGTKTDGEKVDMWFRTTICFTRQDGAWRITHMHNSVPFAMDGSDRALLDLKPD